MKYIILGIIFSLLFLNSSFSQVLLKDENIQDNQYNLEFENNVLYRFYNKNGKRIISFPGFQDPSQYGQFILPEKNLFIPIPSNAKPSAKLIFLNQEKINAIPEINPNAVLLNDSTVIYTESNLIKSKQKPELENKGYLWIGDKYYINLKVQLFEYSKQGFVLKNSSFKIILSFKNKLNAVEKKRTFSENNFTVNTNLSFQEKYQANKYQQSNYDSWIDYSKTYLKLGVTKDAIYRISKNDLIKFDINANSIDPRTFKLFLKGKEIPIYVRGEVDNSFDDNDFIEFYGSKNYGDKDYRSIAPSGQRYKEFIDRYTDTTAYWLTWDGDPGKRVDTVLTTQGVASDSIDYYDEFLHYEKNLWYDFSLSGGEVRRQSPEIYENETWDWWVQGVSTKSFSFNVINLKPGRIAKAYVKIQSWASNISTNAHNLEIGRAHV